MCEGFSDGEDWLELNNRELKTIRPGLKSELGQAAGKAPAPVAGPHVGPALGPDAVPSAGLDAVDAARGPNFPILAKPPTKVGPVFVFIFRNLRQHQLKSKNVIMR